MIQGAKWKIIEATFLRVFFCSTLHFSMQQEIDMVKVLKYSFTHFPFCLSHVHGSVNSTPKSSFLNYIDSQFVAVPPLSINTTIIDAAFFLHLQINLPDAFGGIARSILKQIMGYSENVIHFVADKLKNLSIKDIEHVD